MKANKVEQIIQHLENHLGCWRQFSHFINLGRTKKFGVDDEDQFLEIKSVIVQETEMIMASVEVDSPSKDEIHTLLTNAPSLRCIGDMNEGLTRNLESQWHKIYIGWHAILGQLKVQSQRDEPKVSGFFSKRA
jgi:hypothetical protein